MYLFISGTSDINRENAVDLEENSDTDGTAFKIKNINAISSDEVAKSRVEIPSW